jgi:hypothetical protein
MNTLQKRDWQCDGWKYIHDSNDTQAISDICEMAGLDDGTRRENSLLICAAPDMLEALEYVVEKIADDDVLEKCIKAIMKAKGLRFKRNTITTL